MRYLRENTATRITIGPFYDVTDGITPEIALTVTNCFLTFIVDDAGVPTLVLDVAPTASGGANDMVHITSDAGGYYDLELAAANVNYTGRATLSIHDTDVHLPVFHEFQILSANVYDSLFADGDVLDVNITQWLGTATATPDTAGVPHVNTIAVSNTAQTANDNSADINTILSRIIGTLAAGTHNPATAAQIAVLSDWIDDGRLDVILDAIKAVTDLLPNAGALSDLAAILTDTGTTLQAELDAIQAAVITNAAGVDIAADIIAMKAETSLIIIDTDDIQTRIPAALIGGRMDSDVEAINNSTTSAIQLALSTAQIESGAAEGTPSTTVIQTDLAETQDDIYIGRTVIFTSGNARGEATDITDYTGATGTIAVTALANAPAAADTFILI